MDLAKIKKVHLIGIGGIGVSAIAKLFLHHKKKVIGSDVHLTEITDELTNRGVTIYNSHQPGNLAEDTSLVVFSPAVPPDNPERAKAKKLNIEQLSYPEFLGELSLKYQTIAISGTNGKSTTTAMVGKIFEAAGFDPTVIVGTQVPGFDGNLRIGKSSFLIVEACEWKAHMLKLAPQTIVLTNLEEDHLDFYKDLDDIKHHFQKFIDLLPIKDGLLVYNGNDENLKSLTKEKGYQIAGWSVDEAKIETKNKKQHFQYNKTDFTLQIPGKYNVANALAAITVARQYNISDVIIKKALPEFPNCWRRFEILGAVKNKANTLLISDYAHHPDALEGLLKATKNFYPANRLFVIFQPHHFDRTYKLFGDFVKSFSEADLILINEVYDVAGRKKDGIRTVGSQKMVKEVQKINPGKEVIFSADLKKTEQIILEKVKENDIVLIVGAGDIDEVARNLTKKSSDI